MAKVPNDGNMHESRTKTLEPACSFLRFPPTEVTRVPNMILKQLVQCDLLNARFSQASLDFSTMFDSLVLLY